MLLRVTLVTRVGRALKPRRLTPCFNGPYQILPPPLSNLHDVFHVSQLRRYILDPSHVIHVDNILVREDLTAEESPM